MKRNVISILLIVVVTLISSYNFYKTNKNGYIIHHTMSSCIEALAIEEGGGGGKCTATYTCVDSFGNSNGSISCTGNDCKRETEKEGLIFITEKRYVECDGKRFYC